MSHKKPPPIHPGTILLEEFLTPMRIPASQLAKDVSVAPRRISEIVKGRRPITADMALRFSRYFGTSAQFWMNLQTQYALETQEDLLKGRLDNEVKVLQPA